MVVHVINTLTGSGGAEHGLVREVTNFGPEVDQEIVTLYGGGELLPQITRTGMRVSSLGLSASRSGLNWPLGARRLAKFLESSRPNVVHSSLASANLVAQLATMRSRIPVLATLTLSGDLSLVKSYQPGARSAAAALFRTAGSLASRQGHVWFRALTRDAAQTNSTAMRLDPSRVKVIPRGIPLVRQAGDDKNRLRSILGVPTDVPLLLNVARQTAQKGQVHLLHAFSLIREERRPVHLVILGRRGDGSEALTRAIAELGLGDDVTVIAYTDRVQDFYRASDMFVFSSLMEGLGTALLEAMAAGLPVVAFDIPPVREVTDKGRLAKLVPAGDERALANAVLLLLDDRDGVGLESDAAMEWVAQNHSIDVIAVRVQEELERVARLGTSTAHLG